jgi:hypothetical protein
MVPNLVFDQCLVAPAADRLRTGGRAALSRGASQVGPGASPRGWTRSETPVLRADDRLLDSSQRAWERSQNMIRSQQVRDRALHSGQIQMSL